MTYEASPQLARTIREFLEFGRPKEGSDRYKAAWDKLQAEYKRDRMVASLRDQQNERDQERKWS